MHRGGTAFDARARSIRTSSAASSAPRPSRSPTSPGWARTRRRGSRGWCEARGGTTSPGRGHSVVPLQRLAPAPRHHGTARISEAGPKLRGHIQSLLVHLHPAKSSTWIWFREALGSLSPSRYSDMTHCARAVRSDRQAAPDTAHHLYAGLAQHPVQRVRGALSRSARV